MTFKIWKAEMQKTNLEELRNTWKTLYPTMTEDELNTVAASAAQLVPNGIKYVLEDDADKDYTKHVLVSANKDYQLLLVWPKGVGKTTSIYYVAQETNNPLVTVQLNGSTGVDALIGKWLVNKEGTYWVDGLFTLAWRYGFWIILDELNMALPEITAILHPALDDRKTLILDEKDGETIKKHPNTRIFAAINPTEDYAGTKEMNGALVDRFSGYILIEYPDARKERSIIMAHPRVEIDDKPGYRVEDGIITRMVKFANSMRRLRNESKILFECSTRNLIDWASRCKELPVKEAAKIAFVYKADKEDWSHIYDELNKFFKDEEQWGITGKTKKQAVEEVMVDYTGEEKKDPTF